MPDYPAADRPECVFRNVGDGTGVVQKAAFAPAGGERQPPSQDGGTVG